MSRQQIIRVRYLVQLVDSGRYLSGMHDNEPTWASDVVEAMTHCHQETAERNLNSLLAYWSPPEECTIVQQAFYALCDRPSVWSPTPLDVRS